MGERGGLARHQAESVGAAIIGHDVSDAVQNSLMFLGRISVIAQLSPGVTGISAMWSTKPGCPGSLQPSGVR